MIEQQVDVATRDGQMPTFIVHPERGAPFPVVLVLMDGLGIRGALRDVARRLATSGYYAMLPDLYYRAGETAPIRREEPGEWDRMMSLVMSISDTKVIQDADASLEHAGGRRRGALRLSRGDGLLSRWAPLAGRCPGTGLADCDPGAG